MSPKRLRFQGHQQLQAILVGGARPSPLVRQAKINSEPPNACGCCNIVRSGVEDRAAEVRKRGSHIVVGAKRKVLEVKCAWVDLWFRARVASWCSRSCVVCACLCMSGILERPREAMSAKLVDSMLRR